MRLWQAPIQRTSLITAVRSSSSGDDANKIVARIEELNKKYYGPERDHVNFPIAKQPDTHPPVRLGFIPATWFEAFYEKTGVTG